MNLLIKASEAQGVSGKTLQCRQWKPLHVERDLGVVQKIERVDLRRNTESPRAGDVRDSQADTTAAVRELGHNPEYTFEDGLRLTLQWYRADLEKKGTLQLTR